MRKLTLLTLLLVGAAATAPCDDDHVSGIKTVLKFKTMIGAHSPFIGAAGAIRGVTAAPLPWVIQEVGGNLKTSGQLEVEVKGLVLANDPSVPASLRGTNPVPFFAAIVSCETNVGGTASAVNVTTGNFPADTKGNAEIKATVALPTPCIAPIIFVTSPNGGVWFAATGR